MAEMDAPMRPELLDASDEQIDDTVKYIDPMVARGLLYQLTGDPELKDIEVKKASMGFFTASAPAKEEDTKLLQRKTADYLKAYRDAGAGFINFGPEDRLPDAMDLAVGDDIPREDIDLYREEAAINPWARALEWQSPPDPERLKSFSVLVIGAGMGGLNAALQLERAGIPFTVVEKNDGVGGTWWENRYPGARVDTPSRSYTNIYGVDFGYPNPFCEASENRKYFEWVADNFDLRKHIRFQTEVRSLTWNEEDAMWEARIETAGGAEVLHANAVFTAVGFLNRPNLPEFEGMDQFEGPSWHTARWPQDMALSGKRFAVIGTGATGYQMVPELALEATHVTVFQRTPQWLFDIQGYRSPFPPQVNWLDRNMPYYTNFMRLRNSYAPGFAKITEISPGYNDPLACSPENRMARDACVAFLERKLPPELVARLTPEHPVWSARALMVDPDYSFLDAIQRDNVTLVTGGVESITRTGVVAEDGTHHEVDAIVYATGFHATDYLFPMAITGKGGRTIEQLWAEDGARAYLSCMMPGFPNLWSIYGPNTNGALTPNAFHEMVTLYAMQCMEKLILEGKRTVDAKKDAYWRYNHMIDEGNNRKVWSDPRARNYYWTEHGRSAVQNPLTGPEMWHLLRRPDFGDLEVE